MKYNILAISLTVLLCAWKKCHGFEVPSRHTTTATRPTTTAVVANDNNDPRKKTAAGPSSPPLLLHDFSTALFYRRLKDSDTTTTSSSDGESNILEQDLRIRTPFFFNPKQALQEEAQAPKNGINLSLLKALYLNQALNLGLAMVISTAILVNLRGMSALGNLNDLLRWTGSGPGMWDLVPTLDRIGYGLMGALPLVLLSTWIEQSDKRAFSNVNLSTITFTLTLFGRRSAPSGTSTSTATAATTPYPTTSTLDVFVQSLLLASVVGFSEEAVFRRIVPAELALYNGVDNVFANLMGAAFGFAVGHLQPKSGLGENAVTLGLQFINGIGFGLIYVLSGGDLVPCIVAHAVYDFVAFFKTWVDANDQIEYAESMFRKPFDPIVEQEAEKILRQVQPKNPKALDTIKMLFYTFDFDKNGSLSLSEVRKGVSYHSINQGQNAPPQEWIDQLFQEGVRGSSQTSRMTFPEFLRLTLLSSEKGRKAMAYS